MTDSAPTRQTLLLRLAGGDDRQAWEQFVEIYAPLVFQFARRRGLQDSDAADVVQEVLISVAEAFRRRKYDRSRGAFRGWLLTIARNEVNDWLTARGRRAQASGGTTAQQALGNVPADSDTVGDSATWDRDYEERLFAWAADRVKSEVQPATWQAFWQTTIDQRSGQEVAAALGLTVAAVYLAKSRVMKRLRELVREIDDETN
jgi:RNA polymerase sigma-70 factor (ECF subfamily)